MENAVGLCTVWWRQRHPTLAAGGTEKANVAMERHVASRITGQTSAFFVGFIEMNTLKYILFHVVIRGCME
jgi:hypothetical protein